MASNLAATIMPLLPQVNDALKAHHGADGCPGCSGTGYRDCPMLGLIASVLDVILWCWRLNKSKQDGSAGRTRRDLRAAVLSRISLADGIGADYRPRVTNDQRTGPYYVILDVAIRDVGRYLTYMDRVTPALEAAGGRYLARGGPLTTYEGDWNPPRIVLMEFPSQQAWESFYHGTDYEAIKPIRDEVSTGRMIGVEGLAPGVPAAWAPRPVAATD